MSRAPSSSLSSLEDSLELSPLPYACTRYGSDSSSLSLSLSVNPMGLSLSLSSVVFHVGCGFAMQA